MSCELDQPVWSCLRERVETLAVCARTQSVVHGIEVSVWQGTVDWQAAKQAGVEFAFARAADGASYRDGQFAANGAAMKSHGVRPTSGGGGMGMGGANAGSGAPSDDCAPSR